MTSSVLGEVFMDSLKALYNTERFEEAWNKLLEKAGNVCDYTTFLSLCHWRNRLATKAQRSDLAKTVKIALLSGATTEMIKDPLTLALETIGLGCQILQCEYNTYVQEMLDPESASANFRPDVAVVVTTPANLPKWQKQGDDLNQVRLLVEEVCEYFLGLCARLRHHTQCEIILNNFHPLPIRPLGNLGAKTPWDANNFIRRINLELGDRAPAYVHINDVEALSASYGVRQWFDLRYWFHAKQPVSFQCLVPYVRNTARIIGALFGYTAKCLVLDLDNTLWGGVVGDDGVEGIAIGEGDAVSEAFKAFQNYVLNLKQRGVLLAVCSKNEEINATAPFLKHPGMVLKLDDFVSFKANWKPKPDNLKEIAAELNIGINSIVFVDDNPAECEHVRQSLPEVHVIKLSDDPSDFPRLIDEAGFFETTTLSTEDLQRTQQYHGNIGRKLLYESSADYTSYLTSLEQMAVIHPFEERYVDRITQLINKTNQFNLTTLRLSRSQVKELLHAPNTLNAYVRMADRFGDNGLISVFCGHRGKEELWIDEWLMSCRVLKRGVEQLLCNYIVEKASEMDCAVIHGTYLPTPKNGLVRDHYKSLGFIWVNSGENGATHWRLDVKCYKPFEVPIKCVEDY
jgi:FkbH-like protein